MRPDMLGPNSFPSNHTERGPMQEGSGPICEAEAGAEEERDCEPPPNCSVEVPEGRSDGKARFSSGSESGMDGEIPNIKKWVVFYPIYINSKKTVAEGRRIALSKACENPTCAEIGDCCSHLKLPFAIEIDKAYPRDFMQRGRVRVSLKREDGTLYNPSISSRKQMMVHVAELVPRHPGRTKKQEAPSTSGTGPSKPGKGGRKKR